ncbi:unnamed protein product [Cyprideis torosa]|uniref:Uncharacterized protein n=1 Tax=Cyprideis torosa TaxID=163714 RepID=A0A7R8WPG1_9CRUS|nr:unnamed protein product [Cyprideis torosa]CAG0906904.1 unnamed protein product [Cyprideis torosa]
MRVGSSKLLKTNVRVVAATNVNVMEAVQRGRFREDLYYRLNTMQIDLPALRNRKEDIPLLLHKFLLDFSERYKIPQVELTPNAMAYLVNYLWPGNIRQLRNFCEQITVVEKKRMIDLDVVQDYLPPKQNLPILHEQAGQGDANFANEREILYKFLFDMKKDLNDLRALTLQLLDKNGDHLNDADQALVEKVFQQDTSLGIDKQIDFKEKLKREEPQTIHVDDDYGYEEVEANESFSLQDNELELIKKALEKYNGKRKYAAKELGISERTLYRKIKQYDLN